MFENKYIQQRIEKANKLRELGHNPYSNKSERTTTISKYINVNTDIYQMEDKRDEHRHYTVSGRIKFFRLMGKASFLKIEDESGILQIYVCFGVTIRTNRLCRLMEAQLTSSILEQSTYINNKKTKVYLFKSTFVLLYI